MKAGRMSPSRDGDDHLFSATKISAYTRNARSRLRRSGDDREDHIRGGEILSRFGDVRLHTSPPTLSRLPHVIDGSGRDDVLSSRAVVCGKHAAMSTQKFRRSLERRRHSFDAHPTAILGRRLQFVAAEARAGPIGDERAVSRGQTVVFPGAEPEVRALRRPRRGSAAVCRAPHQRRATSVRFATMRSDVSLPLESKR